MKEYNQYYNTSATQSVLILKYLYAMSVPLARLFIHYKITPHMITSLSNLSAILAYIFLFSNVYLFAFFWFISLIFDICDGMVARMTGKSSAVGSFYDHYSDIVKIILLYFFIAIKYDVGSIWVLAMLNVIAFMLMAIANTVLAQRNILIRNHTNEKMEASSRIERTGIMKLLYILYSSIFVIYGNFNLLLIPLAFNIEWAYGTFTLLFIVVFKSVIGILKALHRRNIYMEKHDIMWK